MSVIEGLFHRNIPVGFMVVFDVLDKMSYGGCMSSSQCDKATCRDLLPLLPRSIQNISLTECNKQCCDSSLCNHEVTALNPDPTNTPPTSDRPLSLFESKKNEMFTFSTNLPSL